jgi:hypothetical protein
MEKKYVDFSDGSECVRIAQGFSHCANVAAANAVASLQQLRRVRRYRNAQTAGSSSAAERAQTARRLDLQRARVRERKTCSFAPMVLHTVLATNTIAMRSVA